MCTDIPIPPENTNLALNSILYTLDSQVALGKKVTFSCKSNPIEGTAYINAFEDDIESDSIDIKCKWNNQWSNETWPICLASKFFVTFCKMGHVLSLI